MKKLFVFTFLFCCGISFSQNETTNSIHVALKSADNDTSRCIILNKLADSFISENDIDSAFYFASEALRLVEIVKPISKSFETSVLKIKGKSHAILGACYLNKGRYPEALKSYNEAIIFREKIGDEDGTARATIGIAFIYCAQGKYSEAISCYLKGLKYKEKIKDKLGIANCYVGISDIYALQGNYDLALKNSQKGLKTLEELGDKRKIAVAYYNLGNIYSYQHKNSEALNSFTYSLKLAQTIGDSSHMAHAYTGIGNVYIELGDLNKALENHEQSLKITEFNNEINFTLRSYINIANIYSKLGKHKMAEKYCLKGVAIAKEIENPDAVIDGNRVLSNIYGGMGDYKKSLEIYKSYINDRDSLYNLQEAQKTMQSQMEYDFNRKQDALKAEQDKKDAVTAEEKKRNFYIMLGLGLLLLLTALFAWLIVRQNKLRSQQQAIQLEQKLLRSQMNPHFIFNSLQAIQNFILKNDTKEAVKYLSSFANVTRAVLENSINETISLKKEIDLLEQYLQLQKLRYGNRFDFSITISPQVDTDALEIPPMLAQPFIENAIEHGMSKMQSGGLITIEFSKDYESLFLEIKDNGAGISEQQQNKEHHSRAMTITKERIALLNKNKSVKTSFTISEAYPGEANKGVKISFSIPI